MMTLRAFSAPISRGSRYVPPQPGTRPRKHSGSASAGTPEEIVRYVQCSATSTPPPIAAPFTNANEGTASSPSRRNTSCPSRAISQRLVAGSEISGTPLRSAPTAKMNGLPVTPTATRSSACRDRVQGGVQRGQAAGAERVRLGVVESVVQRDQRHRARAVRQLDVADDRLGDDLVGEEFLGDHLAPSQRRSPRAPFRPCPSRCTSSSGRSGRRGARRSGGRAASSAVRRRRPAGGRWRSRRPRGSPARRRRRS